MCVVVAGGVVSVLVVDLLVDIPVALVGVVGVVVVVGVWRGQLKREVSGTGGTGYGFRQLLENKLNQGQTRVQISQNLEIPKSQNPRKPKIPKSQNLKISKSENLEIPPSRYPSPQAMPCRWLMYVDVDHHPCMSIDDHHVDDDHDDDDV